MDARLLSFKNSKKSSPIWARELIDRLTMIKYFNDRSYSNGKQTSGWFVWYSRQLINTVVLSVMGKSLGLRFLFNSGTGHVGGVSSPLMIRSCDREVSRAQIHKTRTSTASLNPEKRNLMSWASKGKLQTNDTTNEQTAAVDESVNRSAREAKTLPGWSLKHIVQTERVSNKRKK